MCVYAHTCAKADFSIPVLSSQTFAMKPTVATDVLEKPPASMPNPGKHFLKFVDAASFPCVGAKSALARGSIETHELGILGSHENDQPLLDMLSRFVGMIESDSCDEDLVHSLVAIFSGPDDMTERCFETLLWTQLWQAHELDVRAGSRPAPDVSSDATDSTFSLSMAGHPFFIIGLHARASRLARRFRYPVLVFNSHRQFEKLRMDGRYERMQAAIRVRDIALQGSINPNLADFGDASEARQYSGRRVASDWKCPFDFRNTQ